MNMNMDGPEIINENADTTQSNMGMSPSDMSAVVDSDPFAGTEIEEATPSDLTPEIIGEDMLNEEHQGYFNSRTKSILLIGVGVLLVLVVFLGIMTLILKKGKSNPAPAAGNVNLTYWGLWEDEAVYDEIFRSFEKSNPGIKIKYVKETAKTPENQSSNYLQKLIARSKDKKGPDIFRYHNTWIPVLAQEKLLAPLPKNVMKNEEFDSIFYEIHKKDLKIKDSYYGLPLMIDGLIMIYNKDLFDNAGVKPPQTWEELQKASSSLTVVDKAGRITSSGLSIGTANNLQHFSDIFGFMLLQNGGNLAKLSNEEGVQTLKAFRSFAVGTNAVWNENLTDNIAMFVSKKVAMVMAPSWQVSSIKTANPSLNIATSALPRLPGANPLSIANYWVEGVSTQASATQQQAAWKLLKYMIEKENLTKIYSNQMKTRVMGSPYPRVDMRVLLQNKDPNNYASAVMEHAPYFVSLPMINRTFDQSLNDPISIYIGNAIEKNIQGVTYEAVLQDAEKGVLGILTRYNIKAN